MAHTKKLGPLIKKSERKLRMYVIYCQNKPVSEHIVAEHLGYFEEIRIKLKHKLVVSIEHILKLSRLSETLLFFFFRFHLAM